MRRIDLDYTKEDFLTTAPYEQILTISDNFQRGRAVIEMSEYAASVGFKAFKKMLGEYQASLKQQQNTIFCNNATSFEGQTIELDAGDWRADDFGVSRHNGTFEELACCHPILPTERLTNIDTGVEKLKIAYSRGKRWREVIVDKKTLANANSIISLADLGVAITSENARYLVRYLHDIENLNYDAIPERKSVARLGYIEGEGFSPYVDGLIFDGDANLKSIFDSIKSHGKYKKWLDVALNIRKGNVMARIVLAAAFASVLVKPIGGLPFFVHLWGGESGTGKTVALMVAASVWGNPEMGRYIQTFNSTVVGREKLASFLNNLPLLVDELQLAKDSRGKLQFDVYALAEGVGRTRGTKTGGIDKTPTWSNCMITSGESPLTSSNSGAGAIGRVIEIECLAADKIIDDGHAVSAEVKRNYGFAGREFVERLYADKSKNIDSILAKYVKYRKIMEETKADKQAGSAAILLVADELATEWIFKDDNALKIDELSEFLRSKSATSAGDRGYRYMCDWVTQNANKLRATALDTVETFGQLDGDWVYIIGSVFRKAAEDAGFSSAALLSWLKEKGLIEVRGRRHTRGKRINGVLTECVKMKLLDDSESEFVNNEQVEQLPFGDFDEI